MPAGPVDPLASVASFPVIATLLGEEHTIPAMAAVEWLSILLDGPLDVSRIIPGLLDDDVQDRVDDALWDGELTEKDLVDTALAVLTVAAGRSWWRALHLLSAVGNEWLLVHGRMVMQGVDPGRLSLGGYLDALYAVTVDNMTAEQRRDFDRVLDTPPAGELPVLDEDAEGQEFLALMSQVPR